MNEAQTRLDKIDPKLRMPAGALFREVIFLWNTQRNRPFRVLRNNPYMRDHITKWAALGARGEVIRLRDALCEAFGSEPAT